MLLTLFIMKHIKPKGRLAKVIFAMAKLLLKWIMLLVFGYPDLKSYSKRNQPRTGYGL
jgi:hypothetical protein